MDILSHEFENGQEYTVRLHVQNASFYSNSEIYSASCAVVDIVLAKGVPETITESFYKSMRAQQQRGGQSNKTLTRRAMLNWCLSSLRLCELPVKV